MRVQADIAVWVLNAYMITICLTVSINALDNALGNRIDGLVVASHNITADMPAC